MGLVYHFLTESARAAFKIFYTINVWGNQNPHPGGAIIAANHLSNIDPPLLAMAWPEELSFLAHECLFQSRFLNWIVSNYNGHPIKDKSANLASVRLSCELIKAGRKVVIFPEGIRSADGSMGPFKKGIGLLASQTQAPIIPCYLQGSFDVWPPHKPFPRFQGKIQIVFGSPIPWSQFENLPKNNRNIIICQRLEEAVKTLQKWLEAGAVGTPP